MIQWQQFSLGDVSVDIQTGPFGAQLHQSDYSPTGFPVVMPKDIVDGRISLKSIARIGENHVRRLMRYRINEGDILYSRRGDVGRCAYVCKHEAGWLCGTGCLRVTIKNTLADSKFVFFQLQMPQSIAWVENHAIGSTMKNLNTGILSRIPLLLPPLPVQRQIADVLSAYDDLIENSRKQIKLLEEAAQRLYKEWFIDLRFPGHEHTPIINGVPEGWKRKQLTEVAHIQYGYAFDGSLFNSCGKGMPIIRIRNIPSGTTDDYTTEAAEEQYIVKNGDIVVWMDGEFHINFWGGEDAYLVQRTCRIRPSAPQMKGWLLWAIREPIKFFEKTVVGSTVAHLGKKHIDTIALLIPPDSLYKPFMTSFEKRVALVRQDNKLAEARDRLLTKLLDKTERA